MKQISKRSKITLISLAVLIITLVGGFFIYTSQYYRADEEVYDMMNKSDFIQEVEDAIVIKSEEESNIGMIFYPGAKVEYTAYIPILEQLSKQGVNCILVKMPFNMAIFDKDAAADQFDLLPEVTKWYIGGHSMGGAMASSYAAENPDKVQGLILLGAYRYGDYPVDRTLTIYGSFNDNLEKYIDYTENVIVIPGGNHAQFGNYGEQKGDPKATISDDEQQRIAVEEIVDFIKEK